MTPSVVLVGPPGAGKTTVGRMLAQRRGEAFRDTDADIEDVAGATIGDIFLDQGEEAFRTLERQAVATALDVHSGVLALGGGAVLDPHTRARLSGHRVVFLSVGLSDAAHRVGLNRDRPLLLGNPRAQLRTMLDARRPLYAEVASLTVDTDGRTAQDVADEIEAAL